MGSFQQISIGAVCLVAAFAFGNYVNTHPPGEHPHDVAKTDADAVPPIGNVQSRLTNGIELIEKQPASIATMRNRLQPRFSMPQSDSTSGQPSGATSSRLPPPNQLAVDKNNSATPGATPLSSINSSIAPSGADSQLDMPSLTNVGPTGVTPQTAKVSDVPDFSSIMNELEGTPITLPPLGKMPQLAGSPSNRGARAIAKPRNGNSRSSLKDLAGEFKMATALPENDVPNPWKTEHRTEFSADDFAPRLKGSFPGDGALKTAQVPNTTGEMAPARPANPQPLAKQYADTPESSNHIVSRQPIPPEPFGTPQRDDSLGRLAPIQHPAGAGQRIARAKPSGQLALGPVPNERERELSVLQNPVEQNSSANLVRTKLPFALNDQGKQKLVAIKSRAKSQLALNTTKFVDHVVQPGETLQSISKRYFGNPDFYLDIYLANRSKLKNPVNVESGIAIRIPIYE